MKRRDNIITILIVLLMLAIMLMAWRGALKAQGATPRPVERALAQLHPRATHIRCGEATCRATLGNVTTFYVAVKWRSDGRWHFRSIGAVS